MLNRLPSTSIINPAHDAHSYDLREGVGFLWRQWAFIASIVGAVVLVAAVYVFTTTPRYTAGAQVLLDAPRTKAIKDEDSDLPVDFEVIENQIAIIKSTVFLQRVVEKIDLVSEPEFGGGAVQASVNKLSNAISVSRMGMGHVLSISVTSVDPARAAKLANALADGYVVEKLDARFEAAKRASGWLSDRLVELRKQLRESEEAVAQFRADHGLTQSGNNVTLNQQQLSELNAKLVDARADVGQKKARVDVVRSILEKGTNVQNLPDLPISPQLQSLRTQEAVVSQKVADLSARYTDGHPLVVNARAELRDVQRAIATELQSAVSIVTNEYELAKARAAAMERSLREATGQTDIDEKTAITLRELERTATVNKNLFEEFLQRAKITDEQATFDAQDARVITPASRPVNPSYPNKTQIMTIALIIGCFLGVGGAVAKDKLNGGFATPRQIEDMLQVPLLSSVNVMNANDLTVKGKVVRLPIYPAVMPLGRFSEAIRTLRSGIQMADVDSPPKLIQITSTVPNEGKTTIAMALAVSAAVSGLKVLFIDCDLRHTSATKFCGMLKQPGLVDLLLGDADPTDVVRFYEDGKMWVLPAGTKTRNPADLLSSNRMKELMEQFREVFDIIFVDSPPIGPVIDPFVLSQLSDAIVYVVRWAATSRELIQQSIQRLPRAKVIGVVFNLVNEKAAQKYGKYAYHYYYGARSYKKYYEG
jgi:capsular exopolysaccharide synthesis family protein